ncbi:sigma-70 family RNA polymerase sigma factor [Sporomusa malonica]|uniref:RNA polymerase sporulation-specific sigma factor n=1 Tax=Sporomusa malonica TaxID=112901 RepID=A0A1W2BCQ1_9FIRM|nr:sigma-70 family RNA polymerase sigma factor [Sporomusa malonica]SMC70550.1 RNA polymerase sporulation-specific sigma factor [Sporomusa malonica]
MLESCFDQTGSLKDTEFNLLANKFRSTIQAYSNKYYLPGGDTDDLYQWGLLGLYKAVLTYQKNRPYSFDLIAKVNIRNMIKSSVTMANRKKHWAINSSRSFNYTPHNSGSECTQEYIDRLFVQNRIQDPLEVIINQETTTMIASFIDGHLSHTERKVILLYIKGYKQRHISDKLASDPKIVDNALQRARKKLFNYLNSIERR